MNRPAQNWLRRTQRIVLLMLAMAAACGGAASSSNTAPQSEIVASEVNRDSKPVPARDPVPVPAKPSAATTPAVATQPEAKPDPALALADSSPAPADPTPAATDPSPAAADPTPAPADSNVAPAATLDEAARRLFRIFSFDQIHELAALAGFKPIRYRLRKHNKVGRWITINTAKASALEAVFDSSNEAGDGYAVAAIAIDTQEDRFKLDPQRVTISYDAESGYYGAVFQFTTANGQVRLTAIEAWEVAPQ